MCLIMALVSSCQTTGTATDALVSSNSAVGKRQIESRIIEASDNETLMKTVIATLQDFGFEIRESNIGAGLISGTKAQKASGFYGAHTDVRVTIATSQITNRSWSVRANFQKIIPSHDPRLYCSFQIQDETLYRNFFNSVEQSIFLIRNEQ